MDPGVEEDVALQRSLAAGWVSEKSEISWKLHQNIQAPFEPPVLRKTSADYSLVEAQRSKDSGWLLGQVEQALKEQDTEIEALKYAMALLKSKVTTSSPVVGTQWTKSCATITHQDPAPIVPFAR
jgi:hypothetical protein